MTTVWSLLQLAIWKWSGRSTRYRGGCRETLQIAPLPNCDAAYEASGSGVRFEYQAATPEPMLCDNCLTIMRGRVFDRSRRHATELRAYSARRDQVITYASIVIDPTLTNLEAITN